MHCNSFVGCTNIRLNCIVLSHSFHWFEEPSRSCRSPFRRSISKNKHLLSSCRRSPSICISNIFIRSQLIRNNVQECSGLLLYYCSWLEKVIQAMNYFIAFKASYYTGANNFVAFPVTDRDMINIPQQINYFLLVPKPFPDGK